MRKTFIIHLSKVLTRAQVKGLTIYRIAKDAKVSFNTVKKYAANDVATPYLTNEVIQMCEYFGLDWHDPAIVEVVENEEDEPSGQIKTQLATA